MELTWSTFVLEIINFLVLVWILKRFLYQPVLDVIAARRKSVEQALSEARETDKEARALKEQYTGRLETWETEKNEARQTLAREIDKERSRRLSDLDAELEREKEKARVSAERSREELQKALTRQALQQGATFAGRLLEKAAGPDVEARLVDFAIEQLESLPETDRSRLRDQWPDASQAAEVSSAFDLSGKRRERLSAALQQVSGLGDIHYQQDESLLAGLRIEIGAWILALNLRDELEGFSEFTRAPD